MPWQGREAPNRVRNYKGRGFGMRFVGQDMHQRGKKMTISVAFFLSPDGDLFRVPDNHIGVVIRDPHRFGLTRDEIEAAYHEHGERLGVEGEARKEILLQIIAGGWIRIRRYPNRHWSVTASLLESAFGTSSEFGCADAFRYRRLQRNRPAHAREDHNFRRRDRLHNQRPCQRLPCSR